MKLALVAFTVLSCLVAAGFAATDKCKFAEFGTGKTLQTGEQQLVEWQCKGAGKTDLVNIELGTGKDAKTYTYVDTINGKGKASSKKFSFVLKDDYPSGDYIARMVTITNKETMPVEEAERNALPWTYSSPFAIKNDKIPAPGADDNSTSSGDDNNSTSSRKSDNSNDSSSSDNNSTANSNGPFNVGATNAVGSTVLFCAGVLALFLGI